ncbi:MAG: twin-arginine translocation signal domain-containing protein [Candidatus Nanohalobium sp.]
MPEEDGENFEDIDMPERLEELVEQKVEKRLEEKLEKRKTSGETKEAEKDVENEKVSRRSFIKMLGVGAGTLALSSSVTGAWSLIQPANQGSSGVNAETVDGHSIHVGSSAPSNPDTNDIWIDTS